jgi:hypothetical protein
MVERGIGSVNALAKLVHCSQPALREVFNLTAGASVLVDRVSRYLRIEAPVHDLSSDEADLARRLARLRKSQPEKFATFSALLDQLDTPTPDKKR